MANEALVAAQDAEVKQLVHDLWGTGRIKPNVGARDALLAATLPLLRSRGLTALPVTYVGKAATFALMMGFPLILAGPDTLVDWVPAANGPVHALYWPGAILLSVIFMTTLYHVAVPVRTAWK